MRATQWEFRHRFSLISSIYILGFVSPWLFLWHGSHGSAWLWLASEMSATGWFDFSTATVLVTVAAILSALLGAVLRYLGSAYLGAVTVHSGRLHALGVVDCGPFAYLRNPLYLGSFFTLLAISILMPPSGSVFTLVVYLLLIARVIGAEEAYLEEQLGEPYREYKKRVPAMLPTLRPQPSALAVKPKWLAAARDEFFGFGVVLCFAIFAWRYNSQLVLQALIVNFGIFLVVRALLPPEKHAES